MLYGCLAIVFETMDMDGVSYNGKPGELELEHFLFLTGFAERFIFVWAEKKGMPNH